MKITEEKLAELLSGMELEEPSMSFKRNVMNRVELAQAPIALKTKVDRKVVFGLAFVFIVALAFVFTYALSNTEINYTLPKLELNLDTMVSRNLLTGFLFVDLIIALLYFDRVIRMKKA